MAKQEGFIRRAVVLGECSGSSGQQHLGRERRVLYLYGRRRTDDDQHLAGLCRKMGIISQKLRCSCQRMEGTGGKWYFFLMIPTADGEGYYAVYRTVDANGVYIP